MPSIKDAKACVYTEGQIKKRINDIVFSDTVQAFRSDSCKLLQFTKRLYF